MRDPGNEVVLTVALSSMLILYLYTTFLNTCYCFDLCKKFIFNKIFIPSKARLLFVLVYHFFG